MINIKKALQIIADYDCGNAKEWRKTLHKHIVDPMPKSNDGKNIEEELAKRLKIKPMPKTEILHRKTAEDKILGGLADGMDDDEFDDKQLDMGEEIEYEHTDDKDISREIAKDHLFEISDYYNRLTKMEEAAEDEGMVNEEAEKILDEKAEKRKNASLIVLCSRCEDNIEYCNCEDICPNCEENKEECKCACKSCGKMPDLCSCKEEEDIQDIIDPDWCDNCDQIIDECECDRCDNCHQLSYLCNC